MADARDFRVKDSSGALLTGAAGSFTVIARSITGAVRMPPSVVELGEGVYRVVPTDDDEAVGTVLHVDCGAGSSPRRHTIACFKADRSNQFWALHVENPDGTVWTGTTPTVTSYRSGTANLIGSAPAVTAVEAAYLYVVVPSSADITADVEIAITGPAGSSQPDWIGQTAPVVVTTTGPIWPDNPPQVAVPDPTAATLFGREAYTRQLKALLPPGVLYALEPDSNLSRLLEGCADELTRVNARGADLLAEADPRTATETLADWETMVSLPDDFVPSIPATTAQRRSAVASKYTAVGGQNAAFFTHLVELCGYTLNSIVLFHALVLREGSRVDDRCYDDTYAYTMQLTVTAGVGALTSADFERVIRGRTHAGITVQFIYL